MTEIQDYKCPNCAARMVFNSKEQKMKCDSCGTDMDMEAFKAYDEALKASENNTNSESVFDYYEKTELTEEEASAYVCESCGGEIVTDANTVATECPYCGNTAIVATRLKNALHPNFVIPFKLDKNGAKKALQDFYKNKFLVPKVFKENKHFEDMIGLYTPFWLYDSDTNSTGIYNATKVKSWTQGNKRYTKTDYYKLTRTGDMKFEKVPANASRKFDGEATIEAIEPFRYQDLQPFSMAYLSGFLADKYDIDALELKPRVRKRIQASIDRSLRSTTTGYATVSQQSLQVQYTNSEIQYALFPLWILNTKWQQKNYTFVMNGQTGKVVGEVPIDWKKAMLMGSGIFAAAAMVLAGIGFYNAPSADGTAPFWISGMIGSLIGGFGLFGQYRKSKQPAKESGKK